MKITVKSKKTVYNRIELEKKENDNILQTHKITSHQNLGKSLNESEIQNNQQKRAHILVSKNNYESEDFDFLSNNSITTRENYNEKVVIKDNLILKNVSNLVQEKNQFKINKDDQVIKLVIRTKSYDDFLNKKHKEKISEYNIYKKKSARTKRTNIGFKCNTPYEIYSHFINSYKIVPRDNYSKELKTPNKLDKIRNKQIRLSTDMSFPNKSNITLNTLHNKNGTCRLLNLPNNIKLNHATQSANKSSNNPKYEKNNVLNKFKKEAESKPLLDKINQIYDSNQLQNSKQQNTNIWEKNKPNNPNSKPSKNQKLTTSIPNIINNLSHKFQNNDYASNKEPDLFSKIMTNKINPYNINLNHTNNNNLSNSNNIPNSSAKKIPLRKISDGNEKNKNENLNLKDGSSNFIKSNNDNKIFNRNLNFLNKLNTKNMMNNIQTLGNISIENPFQLKHRQAKLKDAKDIQDVKDSLEKSDKKKDIFNGTFKMNQMKDIPKFFLNEKLNQDKVNNKKNSCNVGISSEIDKTLLTPNLSTELTDKTFKGIRKDEESSPLRIYEIERFEDNVEMIRNSLDEKTGVNEDLATYNNPDVHDNDHDKTLKLTNLEAIIKNNLNYINQNIKKDTPPQELLRTKKFSYTDLTPVYTTDNPNKLKITEGFLKNIDNKQIIVDELCKTFLHFVDEETGIENNIDERTNNLENNLIYHSSDEADNSIDEREDNLNDKKSIRINNPIVSRIKKNSFAINISDDEFPFSDDEKIQITNVPVFKSKKLEYYVNFLQANHHKIQRENFSHKISGGKMLHYLLIQNRKFKENFVSYLTYKDLSNLSFTNKPFRREFKTILIDKLIDKIINNEDNNFHYKLWKSILIYSNLINVKYLRKEFLDNLFQKSNYEEEIRKDLLRTMPDDPTFQPGKENYKKLFNILFAYSNYNKKIGYAQGINFIIANSLHIFSKEEEAFMFIDALVNKLNLNDLIGITELEIQHKLETVGKLLEKHTPSIVKYLERNLLNHEFFTTGWIIPLFSNSMKKEILFKFWDFFIIYGWNFFYYFIVSILFFFEKRILAADPNTLSLFIKKLLKSEIFEKSFGKIVQKTFELLNNTII